MTDSVDEVRKASVLGFVFVAGVDLSRKMLKLVTPAGGDLPGTILVKGRIERNDYEKKEKSNHCIINSYDCYNDSSSCFCSSTSRWKDGCFFYTCGSEWRMGSMGGAMGGKKGRLDNCFFKPWNE